MLCCRSVLTSFILVLISWSYYVYVIIVCIYTIQARTKTVLYLLVYHLVLFLFLWTYFKTMHTDIAVVPKEYEIPRSLYKQMKMIESKERKNNILLEFCHYMNLDLVTRNVDGHIRFCKICLHIKPDRAHHCSKCGTCILKMDHHCPWISNCIGFSNYKYFVLLLCYSSLYCVFYAATTLEYFVNMFFSDLSCSKLQLAMGFIIAFGLGTVLTIFCWYHMYLLLGNETTLEVIYEPIFRNEDLSFDIGAYENFQEVFGKQCFLWFIPVWTTQGDGLDFPCRLLF